MPGHATRRQVIAGVLVPSGVHAGTDAGRTRAMAVAPLFTPEIGRTPFRVARKVATLRSLSGPYGVTQQKQTFCRTAVMPDMKVPALISVFVYWSVAFPLGVLLGFVAGLDVLGF